MQIAQFVVGATFAFAHLFVAYTIPVSVPYIYSLADLTSAVASDVSAAASTATASASAGIGSWLKKVAFRAAGEEGLAENVRNEQGKAFGIDAINAAKDLKSRQEVRYQDEMRLIHCIDTSGQVFAILINCFYLAPLTLLFMRFFIRSYTKREEQRKKGSQKHLIEESSKDAAKGVKMELEQALNEEPGSFEDGGKPMKPSSGKRMEGTDSTDSKDDRKAEEDPEKPADRQDDKQESGADGDEKTKEDNEPNEDVEILDSAEAVTDVLDAGVENADKFSKDLMDSKAG